MAETDVDQFVLTKATARAALALVINAMLDAWKSEPAERQEGLQDALLATLADMTAECALGMRVPTKEQFLQFMERCYDKAALDAGAPP